MKKYRIDHYQIAGIYYPMAYTLFGWRVIELSGTGRCRLENIKYADSTRTMESAENIIRYYHEQKTKTTVVSLTVMINEVRIKKWAERAKRFNYKSIQI